MQDLSRTFIMQSSEAQVPDQKSAHSVTRLDCAYFATTLAIHPVRFVNGRSKWRENLQTGRCNTLERSDYPHTLTPKQLMQFMNIGRSQAYELIRTRSDLPKFYVGRCPKIPRDAFFKWYDERWMNQETIKVEV